MNDFKEKIRETHSYIFLDAILLFLTCIMVLCTKNNKVTDPGSTDTIPTFTNFSQLKPAPAGTKTLGGDNFHIDIFAIKQTPDKGYICGGIRYDEPESNILIKLDSAGDTVWIKSIPEINNTITYIDNIIICSDGGYLLALKPHISSSFFISLVKLDAGFNVVWRRVVEGEKKFLTIWGIYQDTGTTISYAVAPDDGIWVTGRVAGNAGISCIQWVYKFNKNGDTAISKKTIDTTGEAIGIASICVGNNLFIVAPKSPKIRNDSLQDSLMVNDSNNIVVIKVDEQGLVLFKKTLPRNSTSWDTRCPKTLVATRDSGCIEMMDETIIKIDKNGNIQWDYFNNESINIQILSQNNESAVVLRDNNRVEKDISAIIRNNNNGSTITYNVFGGLYQEWCRAITQTQSNGFIIAGITESYGKTGRDVWLIKTDSLLKIDSLK